MKKLTRNLLAAAAVITATSASAFGDDICPLVGIDYQQVWMKGRNLILNNQSVGQFLPKSYPGGSVYVGAKFCESLGLELGYDWASKKSSSVMYSGNNTLKSSVRRQGGHLDLLAYAPLGDCFELIAGFGMGYLSPTKIELTTSSGAQLSSKIKKGLVARLRLGASYMINDCVGIRALVGLEGTRSLAMKDTQSNGLQFSNKLFNNSTTAAVGLFYKF